ncbi:MAG: hypothetical protein ABI778_06665 [Ignavibacteriota bacterium]
MKTEEKILDYMDGTLSENESGELLHSLSVSPEKRVVLEQHIKLRELTGLAQKPFAIPQALEANMAERFPAIAEYNREVAGGAIVALQSARPSYIGRVAAAITGFIAQYPVRTGFAVAAASVIGYFALSGNNSSSDKQILSADRNSSINQAPTIVDPASSVVGERGTISNQNSGTLNATTHAENTSPIATIPGESKPAHLSSELQHSHFNATPIPAPKANIPSHRDRIASQMNHASQSTNKIKQPVLHSNVANNDPVIPEKSLNTPPAKTPAAKDNQVADAPSAVAVAKSNEVKNDKVADVPVSNNATPTKDIASSNSSKENAVPNVSLAENNVNGSSKEQNPFKNKHETSAGALAFRVYGSLGGSLVNVHDNDATLANRFEGGALLGVDYVIDQNIAFGLEGGNAAISQLITQSAVQTGTSGLPSISKVVVNNAVTSGSQFYLRAVGHYTFNPEDAFHLEATGGVGAAFSGKASPLVSGALYLIHDFTDNLAISGGLAFAGAWNSTSASSAVTQAVTTGSDPIGYVTTNHAGGTLFTPSYAVRIGVKFRPSW